MNNKERQAQLDNVSDADLAKVLGKKGASIKVEPEDIIEAEFLIKFGFDAYWAIWPHKKPSEGISLNEMVRLLMASRKIDSNKLFDNAQAAFIGTASAMAKKPGQAFKTNTRRILKNTEAD